MSIILKLIYINKHVCTYKHPKSVGDICEVINVT